MSDDARKPSGFNPPNPVSMVLHLFKTMGLALALLADPRVHPGRKIVFVAVLGLLIAAVLGVEGVSEVATNILPVVGQVFGIGELGVDAVVDWAVFGVVAYNLLRLFPAEIVAEHYREIFNRKG
ncbi:MAG TPA: hypothetical protein VIC85_22810 [Ktedonobacterales bacterium]|jgi:hypothetical protein